MAVRNDAIEIRDGFTFCHANLAYLAAELPSSLFAASRFQPNENGPLLIIPESKYSQKLTLGG